MDLTPPAWMDEVDAALRERPRKQRGNLAIVPDVPIEPIAGVDRLNATDLGNARRLAAKHGENFRSVVNGQGDGWLVWSGKAWEWDTGRRVHRLAQTVPDMIREEADACPDPKAAKKLEKWALTTESSGAQRAILSLLTSQEGIPVSMSDLDADPWLFNCQNGTFNLMTGEFGPHRREDLLTKMAGASYVPDAKCQRWLSFLDTIMGGDQEMVDYLQEAIGYSLCGTTKEQCMWVLHGDGSNGKSTFMETILLLTGSYGRLVPPDTFAEKPNGGIPNDVASLAGCRFALASETKKGAALDMGIVKRATGDKTMSARFMRGEYFDFPVQLALWMPTNHKPIIKGNDHGSWRRIRLVPFTVTIPDDKKDENLGDKLKAELDGILWWALQGLARWHQRGMKLPRPEKVVVATQGYRDDMDTLAEFFEDRCTVDQERKSRPSTLRALNSALYDSYAEWAEARKEHLLSQRTFSMVMKERGFEQDSNRSEGRKWVGLSVETLAKPKRFGHF